MHRVRLRATNKLECRNERSIFTGLEHFVFGEHSGDSASVAAAAFSEPWKDRLCLLAQHFIVVSTEQFDESLRLLSRTISATCAVEEEGGHQQGQEDSRFRINTRDNKKANVMEHDESESHHADRHITLRALADGQTCLRDAYAGHHFFASLAAAQTEWDL